MRRLIPRARGTRWAQRGRWELALRAYERRRYAAAEALFVEWARVAEGPVERVQGLYWRGRAAHSCIWPAAWSNSRTNDPNPRRTTVNLSE